MATQTADSAPKVHGPISREDADKLYDASNESVHALLSEMGIAPTSETDVIGVTNADGRVDGYVSAHPSDAGTVLRDTTIESRGLLLEAKKSDGSGSEKLPVDIGDDARLAKAQLQRNMMEAAADSVRDASAARASEGRPLQNGAITEVPKD